MGKRQLKAEIGKYYARSGKNSGDPNEFGIWYFHYHDNKWYYPDDRGRENSNYLEITYVDTINNILSGHFQFTLHRGSNYKISNYPDSLVITDGRFDIRYRD